MTALPLLIVDAANVVGSVPDGWWRDRHGAATRLRDAIADLPGTGLPGVPELPGPIEVVLVVEGAARDVAQTPGVRVHAAPGSGDDAIVGLVRQEAPDRPAVVVATADRGLRDRVTAAGGLVTGPRSLPYRGR
ncbi:hypothetical protein Cs7R123_66930 [Catellatospora sp. TT07R-123]|uniref:hypothetical protein n=1 Tax=Catellatospora sp. TT07R-123 TaxID=2733863 RepID=UPI001B103814|nr:hypothetical protein [Catellatospora sp. TT07R-123]GHJ49351.1 hypothetical protein Cs7R123_66930 [Catellatospora sp. TT07R-123]